MKRRQQRFGSRPAAVARFLEATYCLDIEDQSWLGEIMEASRLVWGGETWIHGAIYDASDVTAFRIRNFHIIDGPDAAQTLLLRGVQSFTPSFVVRSFYVLGASLARKVAEPELAAMFSDMETLGYPDNFTINSIDPSGQGIIISNWSSDPKKPPLAEMKLYRRMAYHLAAAHRYRRRLRGSQAAGGSLDPTRDAEAILDVRGRVLHAAGAAKQKRSQVELIDTFRARELALTSRADNNEGLRRWCPLTSMRWTLVDSFERNGRRYIVACENQACVLGLSALSERERQVIAHLALGQSTKETAYALGISDATVRVLVARAATKLGVKNRRGVLEHPEVRSLVPREA